MQLMEMDLKPDTLLSLTLSDILVIRPTDKNPTLVEMMARVLYHAVLRTFYVSNTGKFCSDTTYFDMLYARIHQFSGKYKHLNLRIRNNYLI